MIARGVQHEHVLDAIAHNEAAWAAHKAQHNVTQAPQQHLAACTHTVTAPGLAPFEQTCMSGTLSLHRERGTTCSKGTDLVILETAEPICASQTLHHLLTSH